MQEQWFNPQPTARKSLFYSQLGSASHNPHQLGFEFDKGQVDHSRKVILSRLRRFDYEHGAPSTAADGARARRTAVLIQGFQVADQVGQGRNGHAVG